MRRWIRWAARLYPRAWRDRYGAEFDALLEDIRPRWRDGFDILRKALEAQMAAWGIWRVAGATAVAGAILAGALSFSVPNRYVSSAVLRIAPLPGAGEGQMARKLDHMERVVLSRTNLAGIIQRPALNLYKAQRARMPMEDVVQVMRDDIRISPVEMPASGGSSLAIRFSYPDKYKAQAVVRELVNGLFMENVREDAFPRAGQSLKVFDRASLPDRPIGPNRLGFVAAGLAVGLLTGVLAAVLRRRPVKWSLGMGAFAAAGLLLGATWSYLIPSSYVSTAVMLIRTDEATYIETTQLGPIRQEILSRRSLAEIINEPSLDLYRKERARLPLEDVVEKMRSTDLKIQLLGAAGQAPSALRIQFVYPDRNKAQAVVRALILKLGYRRPLEVLDPASLPERPVSPNRVLLLAVFGLLIGLALGGFTMRASYQRARAA